RVMCPADTKGFLKQVVYSMVSYARASGTLDARVLDDLLSEIESAIKEQTYQLVMPQFLVTGSVD
ncbi:MAG: hypothetical protein HOI95_23865, partial [Chromatiales bacterium]|nr:hypothetical protein [Chromatiales bacterium]